jgi:hypothetical protein
MPLREVKIAILPGNLAFFAGFWGWLDKLGVTGSSPVSPTSTRPLTRVVSGRFRLTMRKSVAALPFARAAADDLPAATRRNVAPAYQLPLVLTSTTRECKVRWNLQQLSRLRYANALRSFEMTGSAPAAH